MEGIASFKKMKIALIKQETGYNLPIDVEEYLSKINNAITSADVIIGPELSLSNSSRVMPAWQLDDITRDLSSKLDDSQLVIPGTGLIQRGDVFSNVAPILTRRNSILSSKKSSDMEVMLERELGLKYERGSGIEGVFNHDGSKFAVEICRDHGHGVLKRKEVSPVDFEFILACNLGGFYPDKTVLSNGGILAINDGGRNFCEMAVYKKDTKGYKCLSTKDYNSFVLVNA